VHPYLSSSHFARLRRSSDPAPAASTTDAGGEADDADAVDAAADVRDSFVDLAASLAACCGATPTRRGEGEDQGGFPRNHRRRLVEREVRRRRLRLASEIGGDPTTAATEGGADGERGSIRTSYPRRHVVLILCDGMGDLILCDGMGDSALRSALLGGRGDGDGSDRSFFVRNNRPGRLRAVFPSTTPAALTTLATAAWPGRHGE
jgi:hypothetical protein